MTQNIYLKINCNCKNILMEMLSNKTEIYIQIIKSLKNILKIMCLQSLTNHIRGLSQSWIV